MHLNTASFVIEIGYRLLCGCEKIVLKEVYWVAMLQWVTVCVYLDFKNVYLRDATDQSLSQTRIAANTQRGMRAVWTLNQFCVEVYALTQRSYANVAISSNPTKYMPCLRFQDKDMANYLASSLFN